ncbi:MAG: aminoacyl-tRNA hydrolase, partial [Gemmatimonadetes bacterium]|nr:aminoacyl-tRNA hydrolase [Gemmatimonadota bacterium]
APLPNMTRRGAARAPRLAREGVDGAHDLLVVVDDVNLDVGRARLRARGSAGGHNGLKSIEAALGTRDYPRLRIGVGMPPPDVDLAAWVLAPFAPDDEAKIRARIPDYVACITAWLRHGTDVAVRECNR